MVKILLFFIAVLLPASALFSQDSAGNSFSLGGKVIGQDTGYIHIGYFNNLEKYVGDSCYLKNGEFVFTGVINGTTRATLYGKRKSRSVDDPNWTEIFIEPGNMEATLQVGEFKKARITGSRAQNEFYIYNGRVNDLSNQWKKVFDDLERTKMTNDSVARDKIYNEQLSLYKNESNRVRQNFIKEFPGSDISAYLLFNEVDLVLDSLKMYYSLLTPGAKKTFYGNNISNSIAKQEKLQIGSPAPDFTEVDLNGHPTSLKNFTGKYILLEFWASWCIPCRQENPYLKTAYAKYHSKGFVIISCSLDGPENKDAWINAIKKDELPWIQLCDFKGWNGAVISEYNYLGGKGIPANFLIDPQGRIIAKDLRGNDAGKLLGKLMK